MDSGSGRSRDVDAAMEFTFVAGEWIVRSPKELVMRPIIGHSVGAFARFTQSVSVEFGPSPEVSARVATPERAVSRKAYRRSREVLYVSLSARTLFVAPLVRGALTTPSLLCRSPYSTDTSLASAPRSDLNVFLFRILLQQLILLAKGLLFAADTIELLCFHSILP